jgi:hypothetical protein
MQAHLLQVSAALKSGQMTVHIEQCHTFGALFGIRFRRKDNYVTVLAIGNKSLLAIDHIIIAIFFRACLDTL